jgi:hypothetical protein
VEVEDHPFETWTPEMIQLAYSADLKGLGSPGVSYQDSCTPPHENGFVRRGKSPSPAPTHASCAPSSDSGSASSQSSFSLRGPSPFCVDGIALRLPRSVLAFRQRPATLGVHLLVNCTSLRMWLLSEFEWDLMPTSALSCLHSRNGKSCLETE